MLVYPLLIRVVHLARFEQNKQTVNSHTGRLVRIVVQAPQCSLTESPRVIHPLPALHEIHCAVPLLPHILPVTFRL